MNPNQPHPRDAVDPGEPLRGWRLWCGLAALLAILAALLAILAALPIVERAANDHRRESAATGATP